MSKDQPRNIRFPSSLLDMLKQAADENNRSFQNEVVQRLEFSFSEETAIVVGWLKLARWGEIDDRDEIDDAMMECPECGQDVDTANAWLAVWSNGSITGPVCDRCAISE